MGIIDQLMFVSKWVFQIRSNDVERSAEELLLRSRKSDAGKSERQVWQNLTHKLESVGGVF